MESLLIPQTIKFRALFDIDERRTQIAKTIKSKLKLKELPTLPAKLTKSIGAFDGVDFYFEVDGVTCRFCYSGCDTPKGGLYKIIILNNK